MKATTNFSLSIRQSLGILFFTSLLLTSCTRNFTTAQYDEEAHTHETIAILPFEIITTGKMPPDLSAEDLQMIEAEESRAFQAAFHSYLLRHSSRRNRRLQVNLQSFHKTLEVLEANDISIKNSWTYDSAELARLLEVDAVVRGQIRKNQLISDLASFGIQTGAEIVRVLTRNNPVAGVPGALSTSKQVDVSYQLLSKNDGNVLWAYAGAVDADWSARANDIIENITAQSVRRFPYRDR